MSSSTLTSNDGKYYEQSIGSALATETSLVESEFFASRRLRIENTEFVDNVARGEPVSIRDVIDVGLYNVTVKDSYSHDMNSAVVISDGQRVVVDSCRFEHSTDAGAEGGALSIRDM